MNIQELANIIFEDSESSSSDDDIETNALALVGEVGRENIVRTHKFLETIDKMSDAEFQQHFRLTRSAYNYLFNQIAHLLKSDNTFKENIDPNLQLLSSLWILSTPDSYRSIASRFDMAKSSLFVSIERVVNAIISITDNVLKWPTLEERIQSEEHFYSMCRFHGCIGAIDGTYIPIKAPHTNPEKYINRKCFYGVTLQVICDSKRKFLDIFCGYPSSVSDVRIFRNSTTFKNIIRQKDVYFQPGSFIIGDKAYPVYDWCIGPYKDRGNLQHYQVRFNTQLAKTRHIIERAFCLLFGRFRRLKYLDMNRTDLIPHVVQAACVLHNICLMFNDDEGNYEEEGNLFLHEVNEVVNNIQNIEEMENEGTRLREEIAENFN